MHEVFGPAAAGFAAVACARRPGELLWIREAWRPEALNPLGLAAFLDPARLLLAQARDQTDVLAVAEEALRDGAVTMAVIEISRPLDLREGRRLQLAARDGGGTGLCLIPEGMGSNAAETRWQAAPLFCEGAGQGTDGRPDGGAEDSTLMRWDLKKNKSGTLGSWDVRWNAATHRLHVVSPVGERPGSAGAPG